MGLIATFGRIAGTTAEEFIRQAFAMFGADGNVATPRSPGVVVVGPDGVTPIGPAVVGLAPVVATTVLNTPQLALAAVVRGYRAFSEADERVWVGHTADFTAATAAMYLDPDGQDYFAPPYDAGYCGPVYILADSGAAGKKVRFQPW